ncbi:TBC1 domain family member 17-like [Chamaea fasciata]|uniref:TBC1 domain family member 17-like n=1 Tax=Chamaea fasciata TaxID=190680 RepID=UPI00336A1114
MSQVCFGVPGVFWGPRCALGSPGVFLGVPGVFRGAPGVFWGAPGVFLGSPGVFWGPRCVFGVPGVFWVPQVCFWGCQVYFGVPGVFLGSQVCFGGPRCVLGVPGVFWVPGVFLGIPGVFWAVPGVFLGSQVCFPRSASSRLPTPPPWGGLSRLLGGPRAEPPDPEPPFEVLTCVTLGPRPCPARGPPLARADWGRDLSPEELRERIFRGGLSPEVRARGWRLLLGLRDWGDPEGTPESAPGPPRARRDDYFRMKLQWRSLSPGQLRRNKALRGYQEQLERDLRGASPAAAPALLRDVLLTFCMFHFDLGYVGGMVEVLTPLVSVTPDEVEAFWGFCSLMDMVGGNFGPGREGLKRKLGELGALVRVLNPGLAPLMGRGRPRRSCRRWLQFRFQPHLGLEGTRRLCEVLWTGLPCPNFHLLVTCALLELLGDTLGDSPGDSDSDSDTDSQDSDGDKVSPVALEVGEVLSRAEGMFLQLAAATELPPALQELLGLGGAPEPRPETSQ